MPTPTFQGYGLGALPDPPDPRDHLYAESEFFKEDLKKAKRRRRKKPTPKPTPNPTTKPPTTTTKPPVPQGDVVVPFDIKVPIYDQGRLGSCTANEAAAHYQILLMTEGKARLELSRLQIYRDARISLDPSFANEDSGATGRACADVLHKNGACPEELWPYDIAKFAQAPSQECLNASGDHQLVQYLAIPGHELQTLEQIQVSLAAGYPVGFSFTVYDNFSPDHQGIIPMPAGQQVGGHRMLLVGYRFINGMLYFLARNSWSESWGLQGRCLFYPDHVKNSFSDFWTYRLVE